VATLEWIVDLHDYAEALIVGQSERWEPPYPRAEVRQTGDSAWNWAVLSHERCRTCGRHIGDRMHGRGRCETQTEAMAAAQEYVGGRLWGSGVKPRIGTFTPIRADI